MLYIFFIVSNEMQCNNFFLPFRCNKDFLILRDMTNISKIIVVFELRLETYGATADSVTFGLFSDSQVEGLSAVMYWQIKTQLISVLCPLPLAT